MNSIYIVLPILVVLMFLLGIDMNKKAFTDVTKNPKAVLVGMVGQIILLPILAFSVAWILKLPPVYFMGLVLVACCPGGSSSNIFSMLARGNVALSVTLTALSSIITLFTLPIIMEFITGIVSDASGVNISLPVEKLLIQNIVLVFVPLFLGSLFKYFFPNTVNKVKQILRKVSFPALMVLATIFILQYRKEIADNRSRDAERRSGHCHSFLTLHFRQWRDGSSCHLLCDANELDSTYLCVYHKENHQIKKRHFQYLLPNKL